MKIKLKTRIAVQLLVILALLTALISFSQDIRLAKQPEAGHSRSDSASETNPAPLLTELGCNTCHSGLSDTISIRSKAPHLGFAGTKFNSSYLFDYLLNPVKVRQHIGHARMPNFHFTEEESMALTLFLSTQKEIGAHWPDFPKLTSGGLFSKRGNPANGEKLLSELTCLTCHNLEAEGNPMILDLASTAYRMKEDWVKQYLVAPYIFNGPQTTMPSLFYHINEDSNLISS